MKSKAGQSLATRRNQDGQGRPSETYTYTCPFKSIRLPPLLPVQQSSRHRGDPAVQKLFPRVPALLTATFHGALDSVLARANHCLHVAPWIGTDESDTLFSQAKELRSVVVEDLSPILLRNLQSHYLEEIDYEIEIGRIGREEESISPCLC